MFVADHIEANPADLALIEPYRSEPAPLLSVLHAFHDRDGYLSDDAIRAIGKELRIPLADLYGTVTFYHHFSREAPGQTAPRVCTGPVCCQRGAQEILESLPGATAMACAGRCDDPVPVLIGHETFVAQGPGQLKRRESSPIPAPNPGGSEECVFRHIRQPERATLDGYRRTGGYDGLTKAVAAMTPAEVIETVRESKLAGRGGAGFPTGVKWKAVADAENGPKTVVCNADEGEPGCFKDRALMDHDPFAVLEGMTIAAYATGATRGFLYLRYEYPETYDRLADAISAAERAGFLGDHILGSDFSFRIYLRRGAGAYICGEEGALLNSLEGKHPFPRNRPPYPVTHGFEQLPTAVNNVETLASAAQILRKGAGWYRGLGLGENAGTKLISLSGDVQRPGNYEVPFGLPLKTLLHEWAGGPLPGRTIQAITMAGISGGFLAGDALESLTLDEASARSHGSMLGGDDGL
jgi:NADH-quinone oxidoreductase subunit F